VIPRLLCCDIDFVLLRFRFTIPNMHDMNSKFPLGDGKDSLIKVYFNMARDWGSHAVNNFERSREVKIKALLNNVQQVRNLRGGEPLDTPAKGR
jgi:hypothetical protein